jgi:hypothetical protein
VELSLFEDFPLPHVGPPHYELDDAVSRHGAR